jgi:hypothetical protein
MDRTLTAKCFLNLVLVVASHLSHQITALQGWFMLVGKWIPPEAPEGTKDAVSVARS